MVLNVGPSPTNNEESTECDKIKYLIFIVLILYHSYLKLCISKKNPKFFAVTLCYDNDKSCNVL